MVPLLPVAFEMGAECTYPLPAQASASMMMIAGQIPGWGLNALTTYFVNRDDHTECHTIFTSFNITILSAVFICVVSIMLFNGQNSRLAHEKYVNIGNLELV